jgi:hypothetical protein
MTNYRAKGGIREMLVNHHRAERLAPPAIV